MKRLRRALCCYLGFFLITPLVYAGTSPTYTATVYFTISEPMTYEIVWTNVMLNLAKGQKVAEKLATDLVSAYKSSLSSSTAQVTSTYGYDGNAIKVDLTLSPVDPYIQGNAQNSSDCDRITTSGV